MGRVAAKTVAAAGSVVAVTVAAATVVWAVASAATPIGTPATTRVTTTVTTAGTTAAGGQVSASATVSASPPTTEMPPITETPGVPDVVRRSVWGAPADAASAAPAVAAVRDYLAAADTAYATLDVGAVQDDHLAIGPARGEIRAGVAELESGQRHQVGAVTLTRATAFTQKQPSKLLVVACIDSSAVQIVEDGGYAVRAAAPADTRTDLHEYLVQRTGQRWVVHSHAMPQDTRCDR